MALRKKLYFDIVFGSNVNRGGATPTPGLHGGLSSIYMAICAGSAGSWGAASLDRYGNILEPNAYALGNGGTTVNASLASGAKTRQAIGAWFQLAFMSGAGQHAVTVDFIPFGSTNVSVDPATRYRPRVRLRCLPAYNTASSTVSYLKGTLYVQRQHSIEV